MGTQNGTAAEWTRLYPACDVEYGSGPHQFRDNGNSGGSSTGGQNSFVANGTRGTLNSFILDRIDNNSNDNGGVVLRANVDAIQEFKLQTNSYSAEFGRSGGAVVNAVIKSGLNSYHGSVFEFFRCARYSLV